MTPLGFALIIGIAFTHDWCRAGADIETSEQPVGVEIHLESLTHQSEHFGSVVNALVSNHSIALTAERIDSTESIKQALVRLRFDVNGQLSPQLLAAVCNLNPIRCPENTNYVPERDSGEVTQDGARRSWCSEDPKSYVCLPNIRVTAYQTLATYRYRLRKGERLSLPKLASIYCRYGTDADRCYRDFPKFNNSNLEGAREGEEVKVRVPMTARRLSIPVNSKYELLTVVDTVNRVQDGTAWIEPERVGSPISYTFSWSEERNLLFKPQSISPIVVDSRQGGERTNLVTALNRMNFDAKSWSKKIIQPVLVGVWDFRVHSAHCMLGKRDDPPPKKGPIKYDYDKNVPIDVGYGERFPDEAKTCGTERTYTKHIYDHGTAVAAIIAGRSAKTDSIDMSGVNPTASLWVYDIGSDGTRIEKEDDAITNFVTDRSADSAPRVVNVSLSMPSYSAPNSNFEKNIRGSWSYELFVVAAGNDGKHLVKDTCRDFPACYSHSLNNVLSVAALDASGDGRLIAKCPPPDEGDCSSNYGAVDVAAIGEIQAAFWGNAIGTFTGTSAAAPFVTGLASLLFQIHPNFDALGVKQRIQYTGDFTEDLDRVAIYGRVNFSRALGIDKTIVTVQQGINACTVPKGCGIPIELDENLSEKVEVVGGTWATDGRTHNKNEIDFVKILRISRSANYRDRFWIVFDDDGEMKKINSASIANNPKIVWADRLGHVQHFEVSQILDFVRAAEVKK